MARYEIVFKNGYITTFERKNLDLRYINGDEPIYFENLYINMSEVLTIRKLDYKLEEGIARKEGV